MFKPEFDKVYYFHYRPSEFGGVTVAYTLHSPGVIIKYAVAICSINEAMFNKKVGRRLAFNRLTSVSRRNAENTVVGSRVIALDPEETFVDRLFIQLENICAEEWDNQINNWNMFADR